MCAINYDVGVAARANDRFWPLSDRGSSYADSPDDECFATIAGRPIGASDPLLPVATVPFLESRSLRSAMNYLRRRNSADWSMQRGMLSPRYTTQWHELREVS
jgi:hypothetical protein